MFRIGLTDHLEGPRDSASVDIYNEVADLVCLADELGVQYAWFAEHHAHLHQGHLPTPLLFALHLAGKTRRIQIGSAVVCLNLHHPMDVAEQVAVADVLSGNRIAPGFGSGSTDEEYRLFGLEPLPENQRHKQFEQSLMTIRQAWENSSLGLLPVAAPDLAQRTWLAVNSTGAASVAGRLGFNVLFSHLRTVVQYHEYLAAYRAAGGTGLIAANRPVYIAPNDTQAIAAAELPLRILWRRFRDEGKIPRDMQEPAALADLCAHPINFIVGGPNSVAAQLRDLHVQFPFDVLNVELRWAGLSHELVRQSLRLLVEQVMPQFR